MLAYAQATTTTTIAHDPAAAATHAPAETHAVTEAAPHKTGMPQLDTTTFANQIFWLIVALGIIYWVLSRIAPMRASLSAPRAAISASAWAMAASRPFCTSARCAWTMPWAWPRASASALS